MATFVNRAKMTTATTGSGTITLGSASSGFQSFAASGVANTNTVTYVIEDGTAWEIGNGVYTSTGTTLSRTLVSSSTGSLLSLSGSAVVYVAVNAETMTDIYTQLALRTEIDYQSFTAAGTWTKPTGISANAVVIVQMWAGGASGGKGNSTNTGAGGGGGGGFTQATYLASALAATQAVTVGAGGVSVSASGAGNNGGSSSFSTAIVYGGEAGRQGVSSGSRHGSHGGSWTSSYSDLISYGGGYFPDGGPEIIPDQFGGGTGSGIAGASTFGAYWGGGGGKSSTGGGVTTSVFGGAGGAAATAGTAPAGGGGGVINSGSSSGAGARGEVRVWTIG